MSLTGCLCRVARGAEALYPSLRGLSLKRESEVYRVGTDTKTYQYSKANTALCVGHYKAWIMLINKTDYWIAYKD